MFTEYVTIQLRYSNLHRKFKNDASQTDESQSSILRPQKICFSAIFLENDAGGQFFIYFS